MSKLARVLAFLGVDLATEILELEDDNRYLEAKCSRLASELDESLVTNAQLFSTIQRTEEEIGMWRAKVRTLESTNRLLVGDIEEASARINELLAELVQLRAGATQLSLPGSAEQPADDQQSAADEIIGDTTREEVWRLVGIFFDERHWWHLQLGELRIKVPIPDKSFLDQVARRKIFFAAGDAMRLRMRTVTYRKPEGELYAKFTPEEVLAVLPPDRQLNLEETAQPATSAGQGVHP
jgi:hypothetical protein